MGFATFVMSGRQFLIARNASVRDCIALMCHLLHGTTYISDVTKTHTWHRSGTMRAFCHVWPSCQSRSYHAADDTGMQNPDRRILRRIVANP